MPAADTQRLISAVLDAIQESGFAGTLTSPSSKQPRRFSITGPAGDFLLYVYIWTLTFGGRKTLPNEFRIQMTSVSSPLQIPEDGTTVLTGYEPSLNLFAGFDLERHRTFTIGSPSVQVDIESVKEAEIDGLSFHKKSNDEVAVGIRPDQFVTYCLNARAFHEYGKNATVLKLLTKAATLAPIADEELTALPGPRKRLIQETSRLSRDAAFRRRVLYAYGRTCAVTRTQLKLVEAAHILPVGAPGSSDAVKNGLALSPTYHRAYDARLIYLDDEYRMQLNTTRAAQLGTLGLAAGLDEFRGPLGRILLPPDKSQWPDIELIRKANKYRGLPS